jgi:hypothetical protein
MRCIIRRMASSCTSRDNEVQDYYSFSEKSACKFFFICYLVIANFNLRAWGGDIYHSGLSRKGGRKAFGMVEFIN